MNEKKYCDAVPHNSGSLNEHHGSRFQKREYTARLD